jgi:two-component system, OmpR family, alkaline phosphatase synthesis response regulator PhoP
MENGLKKPVVLVVEDDTFLSSVHKNKLTKEGFETLIAANGEEALKMAAEKKPDIILLDLIMPVKDGFETLEELKKNPSLKNIKVVILSNLSQDEDKKRVLEMGAVDYVVKANVAFREIVDLVKKHLAE